MGGDYLQVGQVLFRISEDRDFALRGANPPLTDGRLLHAAMGLLVVAGEERAEQSKPFRISEVRDFALRGANLPLTGGRLLQAAMCGRARR